ncbi:MAG: hypothetical protein KJ914_18815, partial [Gammaproteobacteria bacterium]|nr:hypothetical protein [Gammaproteobacteria bacterium]
MNRAVFLCVLSCVIFATSSAPTLADTIVKPNTFTAGTPANADEVNANFDTVYDQVNKVGAAINVDQPTGNIGIGKTPTTSKLDVNGVIVALGFIGPVDWSSLINVPQTLATLICADREIARFNTSTTLWQCQPNDADTLGGLPASEFAPGEHLHDASDVTGVIHTFRGGT